jgi:AraC-like DNA-binding protein
METVIEATDPQTVRHILGGAYRVTRIDARGQRYKVRLSQAWLDSVRLDQVSFGMDLAIATGGPIGALVFGHVISGLVICDSGGSERPQLPGEVFLAAQPEHSYTVSIYNAQIELAVIDPALVRDVASSTDGNSTGPVRFTGYGAVSAQAAQSWKRTYAYVRDQVKATSSAADQPLVGGMAKRLLVAAALTTFPNDAVSGPVPAEHGDASAVTARRAAVFIDENAGHEISADDIAAAAHVSMRAVQLAFRRHLGTTPMSYLRRVRLERAHRELLAADPARTTVTAVASRWGFASPSRFTAYYRASFGALPSQTLQG